MQLTFIITVDPVKGLSLLNTALHALNLQTQKNFNVVFYNQTLFEEAEIFAQLQVRPEFDYRFFSVDREHFLGNYPLWDLYTLHQRLLDAGLLGDYFMSMHMEEFLDIDYVEKVTQVLSATGFDILLGNLCRTRIDGTGVSDILQAKTAREFDDFLLKRGLKEALHWTFLPLPRSRRAKLRVLKGNLPKVLNFGFRRRLVPSRKGYNKLGAYYEDLYFMSRAFARRYDWFLVGQRMHFEDVHLCNVPGVCELGRELAMLTDFPNYFNLSRIYHVEHRKFYYQLQDKEFTEGLLALKTEDPLLETLQEAIRMYRSGSITLEKALLYTRRNPKGTGTQNLNYKYHMRALEAARKSNPNGSGPEDER